MIRSRVPVLNLTTLEGRLVPAAYAPVPTQQAATAVHAAPADPTPLPPGMVLVGTDAHGEAIYTMTVAPTMCNCAACQAARAAAAAAAANVAAPAPVAPVAPVVRPVVPAPAAVAPAPVSVPVTPTPVAVAAPAATSPVAATTQSVAPAFTTTSGAPTASTTLQLAERDAPGFTPLAQADLSAAAAPDAVSVDATSLRPATAALIGSPARADFDAELALAE